MAVQVEVVRTQDSVSGVSVFNVIVQDDSARIGCSLMLGEEGYNAFIHALANPTVEELNWGNDGDRALPVAVSEDKSNLGLATTREMLTELKVRGEVENYYEGEGTAMAIGAGNLLDSLPGSMLDYRTVDGEEGQAHESANAKAG